jgi:hypothetical protein
VCKSRFYSQWKGISRGSQRTAAAEFNRTRCGTKPDAARCRHQRRVADAGAAGIDPAEILKEVCGRKPTPEYNAWNGYSNRNARSGLILDARRAGIQHANTPTNINRTDTVTIVHGSLGTTP